MVEWCDVTGAILYDDARMDLVAKVDASSCADMDANAVRQALTITGRQLAAWEAAGQLKSFEAISNTLRRFGGWATSIPAGGGLDAVKERDEARANTAQRGSPEHIAKVVAFHSGRKRSVETRAKIGAAMRGKKRTPEQRAALSAARRGVPKSPAHVQAMREAALIRYAKMRSKD